MESLTAEPFLFDGFATGAIWTPKDPRDYDMRRLPGVREALRVGFPPNDERLREHVIHTYNQGATPACVWHAISGERSASEHKERRGELLIFDAMGMHAATGPMDQGRWPGDMLKIAQDDGVKLLNSPKRYRIGSYAYAPTTTPQEWVDTMKAAVSAGHICGIASRLWSGFGWETAGQLLGGETYHEYMLVGYRSHPGVLGSALIKNSWGTGFGNGGFAWVPFELMVMQNFQDRYLIGNTIIDAIDDDLAPLPDPNPPTPDPEPPLPQPVKRYFVTGQCEGGRPELLTRGSVYDLNGLTTWRITDIRVEGDTQPPIPDPPTPDPEPPTPEPQPEPQPIGELAIELERLQNNWFGFRVKDGGQYVSGYITILGARRLSIARGNGATPARFYLGTVSGRQLTATAESLPPGKTGSLEFSV